MKNIFDLLYYGNIRPYEGMPNSKEYNEAIKETTRLSEEIIDSLSRSISSKEAVELFRAFEDAESNTKDLEKIYVFEQGFMLACKIYHQLALDEFVDQGEL